MKNLFTSLLLLTSVVLLAQQVNRQKVIVEVGTGTWCPACPAVVDILHGFVDEGLDIAIIEYHIGNNDPFQNSDSLLRSQYYDFPFYPTTYYDSNHVPIDVWATPSAHFALYEDRVNTLSSFSLDIDAQIDIEALSGTIEIEKVADYDGSNIVLHVVLTESNIPYAWQGETELNYTERKMFPDGNGTALNFTGSNMLTEDFSFVLDPSWTAENLEVTYFIQDNETKEILQGDTFKMDVLSNGENLEVVRTSYFYPNPTKNELYLSANDIQAVKSIEVYDILGKLILSQKEFKNALNVEDLTQGVYLLSYYENDVKKVTKFIKE